MIIVQMAHQAEGKWIGESCTSNILLFGKGKDSYNCESQVNPVPFH